MKLAFEPVKYPFVIKPLLKWDTPDTSNIYSGLETPIPKYPVDKYELFTLLLATLNKETGPDAPN